LTTKQKKPVATATFETMECPATKLDLIIDFSEIHDYGVLYGFDLKKWLENLEQFLPLAKDKEPEWVLSQIIEDMKCMMQLNLEGESRSFVPQVESELIQLKSE
jgi:hypothetical protein